MTVEIKGQQLRIRRRNPRHFIPGDYVTYDPGKKGKLQVIRGIEHGKNKYITQAYRLNLSDYRTPEDALVDLEGLRIRNSITKHEFHESERLIKKFLEENGIHFETNHSVEWNLVNAHDTQKNSWLAVAHAAARRAGRAKRHPRLHAFFKDIEDRAYKMHTQHGR